MLVLGFVAGIIALLLILAIIKSHRQAHGSASPDKYRCSFSYSGSRSIKITC